ncbi:hypothetical protein [Sulfitobacter geojensis]|uniref:hypothetical protein n=1 Tax=Sulfitobacter geojensis TaxID=1342299 RepID=UPI0012DFCBCA|nr:hypothetical protein [Sulfitobacter geojensis]NYI28803.1 hypothetical protein [Sulfitobacter geojensis]
MITENHDLSGILDGAKTSPAQRALEFFHAKIAFDVALFLSNDTAGRSRARAEKVNYPFLGGQR